MVSCGRGLGWVALFVVAAWTLGCIEGGGSGSDISSDVTTGQGESGPMVGMTGAHNQVRAATGAGLPDLEWSPAVAAFAQRWADELARRGCDLEHRPRTGEFAQQYGENIFWGSGGAWSADDVVGSWASEVGDYDHATNSCAAVCGHYTQIVWRDSVRLGCGMSACGSQQVWVCNYDPPGNFIGESPY